MSLFKSIFGGSDSKSVQKSSSKPVDMTPKPFKELQQPLATTLQNLFGFEAIPTMDALSDGGASGLFERAVNETPEAKQIREQGLLGEALGNPDGRESYIQDVIAGKFLPGQEGANPFYDQFYESVARPFSTEFERTVSRTLPSNYLMAGHQLSPGSVEHSGSSAFERGRGIATEGYANALKDLASELGFKTHEAERGRQQEAVQLSQADTELMIKNYEAQLLPNFIAQWGVEQGLKEYQTRVAAALDILKTAAGVTQPTIAQKAKSSGTSTTDTQTGIVPALGTIFSFGGKA